MTDRAGPDRNDDDLGAFGASIPPTESPSEGGGEPVPSAPASPSLSGWGLTDRPLYVLPPAGSDTDQRTLSERQCGTRRIAIVRTNNLYTVSNNCGSWNCDRCRPWKLDRWTSYLLDQWRERPVWAVASCSAGWQAIQKQVSRAGGRYVAVVAADGTIACWSDANPGPQRKDSTRPEPEALSPEEAVGRFEGSLIAGNLSRRPVRHTNGFLPPEDRRPSGAKIIGRIPNGFSDADLQDRVDQGLAQRSAPPYSVAELRPEHEAILRDAAIDAHAQLWDETAVTEDG